MDTKRMLCLELISLLRPSLPKQIIVRSYLYSVSAISFYVAVSLSAGFEPLFPEEKDRDCFAPTTVVPHSLAQEVK